MTKEQRAFMKRHIRSFKPQISHYRRAHAPNRLYLPCELTITEMYVDYVEECKKDEQRCLSYVSYTRELKSQNISFAKLGNEECEICDEHQLHVVANDVQTRRNDESDDVERVKKNGKIKKQNKIERRICDKVICDKCSLWLSHKERYDGTRSAFDKDCAKSEDDTLYLSGDMQKVILIPRLPGYKVCLFTKRVVVINQSFAPIATADVQQKKALGVLWHEGITGRNDEDVTSAFINAMKYVAFRDFHNFVIWLDNCAGQNKNWTLYTALSNFVNTTTGPIKITLKYFTIGHHLCRQTASIER